MRVTIDIPEAMAPEIRAAAAKIAAIYSIPQFMGRVKIEDALLVEIAKALPEPEPEEGAK